MLGLGAATWVPPMPSLSNLASSICALLTIPLAACAAQLADWPEHYEIAEKTASPNGRYAILAPTVDAELKSDDATNFLVDAKTHQILGKILKSDHQIGRNRSGVRADWRADSALCVVQFDSRYGFASAAVLALKGETFQQFDVGAKIKEVLATTMYKKKTEGTAPGLASQYGPDGKIRFRAWADNDPKRNSTSPIAGLFWGAFDTATGKWLAAAAKRVDIETVDDAFVAYGPGDPEYASYGAENKAESIEHELNSAYRVLKAMLPATEFAALKKEQLAWLKKREAPMTDDAHTKMTEERVKGLKARLWE